MTTSMHTAPVLIDSAGVVQLVSRRTDPKSAGPDAVSVTERRIQELVHEYPEVLPMGQIEPAFMPLIPVCMELPTSSGYVDNVWITPAGGIVLGECKLIKNPQARREVLAQALDYAHAVCRWNLDELEKQIGGVLKRPDFRLWNRVREARKIQSESDPDSGLDQATFNDSVQRRLKAGQIMVLIIGDGITEGTETLTSFLQFHAGFHAGLALVDLSLWNLADGKTLVVPRIPMKTVLVERGIVRFDGKFGVTIEPPQIEGTSQSRPPSETEFIEQLRSRRPKLVDGVLDIASRVAALGVTPEFGRSMILRLAPTPELRGSAGYVDSYGTVWLGDSVSIAEKLGIRDAAVRYLEAIAEASGGTFAGSDWKSGATVLGPKGRTVNVEELLPGREKWLLALGTFAAEISAAAMSKDT